MLKKTIKFTDYNGEEQTEDFYFHLSKAKLAQLELESKDGFVEHLQRIVKSKNGKEIIETFNTIIKMAYGQKSEDGKKFIQTEEVWNEFKTSPAYDELFMELISVENAAAQFVNGIVPSDLAEAVDKLEGNTDVVDLPAPKWEDFTEEELLSMPQDEFQTLVGRDPKKMTKEQLTVAMQRRMRS